MLSFFRRLFRLAESEAHTAIDRLEDPIKMTEQGIQDWKVELQSSLKNLAEVKALQIRMRKEAEGNRELAASYEKKAVLLLQRGQGGDLDLGEADRLAGETLAKKQRAAGVAVKSSRDLQSQERVVAQLEANVRQLKVQISTWEGELTTLKARAKVAGATKKLNQHLAQMDSNSTVAMLEKMRDEVAEDEAIGKAYGEIAALETSVDAEIDMAFSGDKAQAKAVDSLAALKVKMGIGDQ